MVVREKTQSAIVLVERVEGGRHPTHSPEDEHNDAYYCYQNRGWRSISSTFITQRGPRKACQQETTWNNSVERALY
eukprot:scaffold345_cov134-Cylindrotheca_fusiformis.AAC.54